MTSKHVQAELPEDLYGALRQKANNEGKPLKRLIQDAIEAYLQEELQEDPLLDFVGAGNLPKGTWSETKDWRTRGWS